MIETANEQEALDSGAPEGIVGRHSDLHGFSAEWNMLADRFENPLLTFDWFECCARAFAPVQRPAVFVVRSGDRIEAIAPLATVRIFGIPKLEVMGASVLCEPTGFLYEDEESLERLVEAVLSTRRPLIVSRVHSDSPVATMLHRAAHRHHVVAVVTRSFSPWIPLSQPWEQFERSISSSRRSSLRRARRHAESLGSVTLQMLSPSCGDLDSLLEEAFAVEAAGWKGREGTAMNSRTGLRQFFARYMRVAAGNGSARIAFLRIGGQPVAVLLGVEQFNRFWVLKIGFDERWAKCSPGMLLMHETIRNSFERELEAYEFLGNSESWIHLWPTEERAYETLSFYPKSPIGLFWFGADALSVLLRRSSSIKAKLGKQWYRKFSPLSGHAF